MSAHLSQPASSAAAKERRLTAILQVCAALMVVSALLLLYTQPASAVDSDKRGIAEDHITQHWPDGPGLARPPALPEGAFSTPHPHPEMLPDVPFSAPQVGPVIKRAFSDDVERRTTAFLPSSLDNLTPIEFPRGEKRWIRVDLSEQQVVAYEGDKPIRAFVISSGLPRTPTVTGEFRIKTKVKAQTMSGGSGAYYYNLPNVKWVQYFYQEYAFHGTYWHNDFGRPKSHGCLNMTNADAKWLFDWAGPKWDGRSVWFPSSKDNPGTMVIITE